MPKCIVTGATGYIGSHVVRHLRSKGWEVSIIAQPEFGYDNIADILSGITVLEYDGQIESMIGFIKEQHADVVMHLAAAVITNPSPRQISTIINANIRFGTELLDAMKFSSTRMFISTGSYWQNYDGTENYNPVDLYAATKEAFEKIVKFYVEAYGFRHINLRLFDIYGEDDKRPKLWTLLRDIAGTCKLLDISAGEQLLDMVHVDDVARAYECAYEYLLDNPAVNNEVFGVCTGEMKPLKEIVVLYQKILDKKMQLNWGGRPYKSREVMVPYTGYNRLPNWKALVNLKMGLTKFNNRGGVKSNLSISPCVKIIA